MDLNERQEAVASALDGCVAVIAGPGSGKTATLVERIRRLLAAGTHPSEIVACTFTVRAASELEARLGTSIGYAGTIHGLARAILLAYPDAPEALGPSFSILDEYDRTDLYRAAHAELHLRGSLRPLRAAIARAAAEADNPFALPAEDSPEGIEARKLETAYLAAKSRLRAEDFDGLIRRAYLLLVGNPDLAADVRRRWKHVSVDEAQDLDEDQAAFLRVLAPPADALPGSGRSLLLVGDPLQSIYGWRGGRPRILLDFAAEAHATVCLTANYRSVPDLVALSNRVAAEDPLRPEGYVLEAARAPAGASIWRASSTTDTLELEAVAASIRRGIDTGQPARSMAVLARTNGTLHGVAAALEMARVPFQMLGERRARLDAEECRGAIAYLRVALNPADDVAVLRALACPARPALTETRDFLRRFRSASRGGSLFGAAQRSKEWASADEDTALGLFEEQIEALRSGLRGEQPMGWSAPVDELWAFLIDAHRALHLDARAEEIAWLRTLLGDFVSGRIPGGRRSRATLGSFVWWLVHGQGAGEYDAERDAVTLSTVHLAKGLEWRTVFVPGLVERTFPSSQAIEARLRDPTSEAIDEERRCFFVAATRASDALVLTSCATMQMAHGGLSSPCEPSRFLSYAADTPARARAGSV